MELEKESAMRLRRTKIRQIILGSLAVSGTMAVAILAPNVLSILGRANTRSRIFSTRSVIGRLVDAGLIEFVAVRGGRKHIRITAAGSRYLQTRLGRSSRPEKWDKRWRVVAFDIREKRRALRNRLRDMLVQIGFIQLQRSVWVFPYDCEDIIALIKADSEVGREVLYMIVDTIENDMNIRNHFGLI